MGKSVNHRYFGKNMQERCIGLGFGARDDLENNRECKFNKGNNKTGLGLPEKLYWANKTRLESWCRWMVLFKLSL